MVKTLITALTVITLAFIALSPLLSPLASSVLPSSKDGECSECHGSFAAFVVDGTYPEVIPSSEEHTVSLKVSNTWKHDITSCSATIDLTDAQIISFTDIGFGPVSDVWEATVSRGGTVEHPFDVTSSTVSVRVALLYDPRSVDYTDLDLSVEGPNRHLWSAQESDNEVVELGRNDISSGGAGGYSIIVDHARGLRAASFTVEIEVDRGSGRTDTQEGPNIGPGGSHGFEWKIMTSGQGSGDIRFQVSAMVHHDHEEDEQDDAEYQLEGSWDVRTGEHVKYGTFRTHRPSSDMGWVIGRVFAFIAASSFMMSTLLGGTIGALKRGLDRLIGQNNRKRAHCWISYIAVLSVAVHVLLLYTGPYSGTTEGLLLGGTALAGMIGIALTGSFSKSLSRKMGDKNWRFIHLGLTILVLIVLSIHAVLEGTEFAFLR